MSAPAAPLSLRALLPLLPALALFGCRQDIGLAQAGYMGDDVVDLPVLRACGFSATVAGGHDEVRGRLDHVTPDRGGDG